MLLRHRLHSPNANPLPSQGSSAFLIDLQQMSFILRNCTSRSLVLLDEFGKGTEADDGAGLFCGVVEWLVGLGKESARLSFLDFLSLCFVSEDHGTDS